MEYSILKDVDPDVTTEKIKSILNNLEISTEEDILQTKKENIYNPCSLRVQIKNCSEYGTNGKGRSLKNAKASAYAEFIERCQNNLLIPFKSDKYYFAPDEKVKEPSALLSSSINKTIKKQNLLFLANSLANRIGINLIDDNKTILVPFYSLKEKKTVMLPILIFRLLQTSNGMAAGNSVEEALVQGLSEICERFAIKKVIEENISLPNIPKEEYEKYKNIKGLIDIFNENNYEIQIKDASLGLGFPVVCTVIKDLIRNTISLSFGAHPSLPISIERCLTEFCQGIDITNRNEKLSRWNYVSKEIIEHCVKSNNLKFLAEKLKIYKLFFEDCEYIKKQFFQKKPSYNFSRECWIKYETNLTNKFLLQFIMNCIKNYTDEIYIRDVSFLGFPSVYIVIPQMSFIFEYDEDRVQTRKNLYDWIQMKNLEEKYSIQKLVEALEYMKKHYFFQDILISEFPKEYLLFLCSILEENIENIEHFGNIIIDVNKTNKLFNKAFIKNVEIIIKYFNFKKRTKNNEEIYELLLKQYNSREIDKAKTFIQHLSFNIIKNKITSYKINQKRTEQIDSNKTEFEKITKNIEKKYIKNITDQNNLSKFFEDSVYL